MTIKFLSTKAIFVHFLEVTEGLDGFDLGLSGTPADAADIYSLVSANQRLLLWGLHFPCNNCL